MITIFVVRINTTFLDLLFFLFTNATIDANIDNGKQITEPINNSKTSARQAMLPRHGVSKIMTFMNVITNTQAEIIVDTFGALLGVGAIEFSVWFFVFSASTFWEMLFSSFLFRLVLSSILLF